MRRYLLGAAILTVALMLPSLAAAKGPESASLTGPGVARSLAVQGQGEMGPGTPLGSLVDFGGFFAQMYGQTPDPTLRTQPKGTLGLRYTIVYMVPGPNGVRSRVVQSVYPYARPVPLTYMRPGQTFWGSERAHGGWFVASADLKATLVRAGLPAKPPSQAGAGFWTMGVIGGIASAVALIALVAVVRPWNRRDERFGGTRSARRDRSSRCATPRRAVLTPAAHSPGSERLYPCPGMFGCGDGLGMVVYGGGLRRLSVSSNMR